MSLDVAVQAMRPQGVHQGFLFQRLRWTMLRNGWIQLVAGSRVKLLSIVLSSLVVWIFLFAFGWWGFSELQRRQIPFAGGLIGILFDLLFFALGVMLVFSTGLILYAGLFSAPETKFLLTTPARADQIFATKFQAAVGFSSWAFVILGGPILIAYGVVFEVPWLFYLFLPIFFVGFVLLPGAIGSLLGLLIVNYFPKRKKEALGLIAGVLILAGAFWAYRTIVKTKETLEANSRGAVQELLGQFAPAQSPLLPSHWMSSGLLALARNEIEQAWLPLALVWSNGLFVYVLAAFTAKRIYRRGFDRQASFGSSKRVYGESRLDRLFLGLVRFLHPHTRLLILKDFRTFRRDPVQWGQLLILGGLLLLYIVNSRAFYRQELGSTVRASVALINLAAAGLLMAANLARFVYPMISLEGRKFWILGLLPLQRDRLLWGKFAFACTGVLILAIPMVLVSDVILGVSWTALLLHVFTVVLLAVGLSGLAVGLSATMPNFRETDPSKIAGGVGGVINMILGLGYMVAVIAAVVGPYHAALATRALTGETGEMPWWIFAGIPVGTALCVAAVRWPMRAGLRKLRTMEF